MNVESFAQTIIILFVRGRLHQNVSSTAGELRSVRWNKIADPSINNSVIFSDIHLVRNNKTQIRTLYGKKMIFRTNLLSKMIWLPGNREFNFYQKSKFGWSEIKSGCSLVTLWSLWHSEVIPSTKIKYFRGIVIYIGISRD